MQILFEDKDLVVCIKPTGVLSQLGREGERNMLSMLKEQIDSEFYPVHRLDKNVGGVMVYAKNSRSAAALSKQIADHNFVKEYYAVIHGEPEQKSAVLEDLLFKDSQKNKVFVVKRMRKGVKPAKLEYNAERVAEIENEKITLVHIRLYTGRTHQIRVQFASRKHPLVGDSRYGAKDGRKDIALWSHKISFTHPASGLKLEYSAPLPDYISELLEIRNEE